MAQQPIISYYFAPFVYTKMTTHSLRVGNLLLFSSLSWLQAHLDWFVFVTALSSGSPPSLDARFSCYFICPSTGFNIYYTPFSLLRLNKFWSLKHQQLCNSASSPESQLTKTGSGFKARPLDSLSHNIHIYWPLLEIRGCMQNQVVAFSQPCYTAGL